ncbi:maltose permease, putative [Talaromyces stipitatus ATCC 10500]|uniref:Maltose permease, putative n=1 Tax=Talaromyces stipitatus (strain ATCC 10500 / CBS 375.48 / QM 6759 / NRRL 1006) TaxID=441959 RepID=B8MP91_TALSN|nr:maltose permease, putative [Talaromyces stipitatus ATCC 10500]EED14330.1 maltose permease, putative [Talaromyces stipitatus ATCC 10500]
MEKQPEEDWVETTAKETMKKDNITDLASRATAMEHELGYWEAFKIYKKGNFYALPAFQQAFGQEVPGHGYQIPARWQVAMSMGSLVGQVVGAYLVTYPMEKYGRKKTFAVCLVLTAILTFMQFFASSIGILAASQYMSGIVWGSYCVIATTYASEVLPLRLRGFLTGYINLCYVMGQFIQTGVTRGFINRIDQWAYRIPFAIQWVWPIVLLAGLPFAPESPWWLIRQDNRMDDAEKALLRLLRPTPKVDPKEIIAMMVKTDTFEREIEVGSTYADCWKGSNRRRMEICICLFVIQNFSGNPVGFATYFFEQIGLTSVQSFDMGVGLNGLGFVGTLCSAIPLIYFGRRVSYIFAVSFMVTVLFIVALISFAHDYTTNYSYRWAQATLLIILQFVWQATLGPLTYVVVCETPSTKLRSKTLAIATSIDALTGLVTTVIGPYLLNPGAANAGAKIEFLYGGISVFSLIWCIFRLPETKGRTFEELDILFERRVPARKFNAYVIEDLDAEEIKIAASSGNVKAFPSNVDQAPDV